MTLSITHTTPADGTFSTTGAAAWDATHSLGGVADISQGGTNATTAAGARTALGLGTIATQDANSVAITGGAISGTSITVKDNVFTLQDNSDVTRQAQFELSGIATGTTRTYTLPDISATVAVTSLAQTFTGVQTFAAANGNFVTGATTGTTNLSTGATTTGLFKTVNVGTGGLSGSTTNITVGSANGSTTTVLGTTTIGGASGNQSLQVNNVASAVNYLQLTGAATGAAPTISAAGSDANISLNYDAKGTGTHSFRNQTGNTNFQVGSGTGSVDYFFVSGSSSGFPNLGVQGASANIGLTISSKGTQGMFFKAGGVQQVQISYVASAVNYLNLIGAVTTGAPELSVQGSDTNINLKLTPKGTGVLQFGTYTAGVLSPTGYITITDAGGTSRRLLVG